MKHINVKNEFYSQILHLHTLECALQFLHCLCKEFICKPNKPHLPNGLPYWAYGSPCSICQQWGYPPLLLPYQTLFDSLMGDNHPMTCTTFIMPYVIGVCTS